jgi:hypothetical protein
VATFAAIDRLIPHPRTIEGTALDRPAPRSRLISPAVVQTGRYPIALYSDWKAESDDDGPVDGT